MPRTNQWGGSLRSPNKPEDEKQSIKAQVDGDPELQAILNSGPPPIEFVKEKEAPDWANQTAEQRAAAEGRPSPFAASGSENTPPMPSFVKGATQPAPQAEPATPPSPPAPPPAPASSAPEADIPEDPAKKPYECVYYWKNDPQTFSARAVLMGEVSDVCFLNADTEVRFRGLTVGERQDCETKLPPLSDGAVSRDVIQERRATLRLAYAIISINDQPLGPTFEERLSVLERMPEAMLQILSDAAWEFQVRLALRIKGADEQLKN